MLYNDFILFRGEQMNIISIIAIITVVVIMIIIIVNVIRNGDIGYRIGKGMFESSEHNLEDKSDISDKEYYDGDGGMLK